MFYLLINSANNKNDPHFWFEQKPEGSFQSFPSFQLHGLNNRNQFIHV